MKVLGINGSPRMKTSSTYHIMAPFLEGMERAGAETDVIHLRQLDIGTCFGCYTCWTRTPGKCVQSDAMTEALDKFNNADIVVFGTPVYHYTLTGLLKIFIERTLPRLEPWLVPSEHRPGETTHPMRAGINGPKAMFLISPCGFPEFTPFEQLVGYFKLVADLEGWQYLGEILRPGAEPLSRRELQRLFTSYYTLVRRAGQQVMEDGAISPDVQADLRKDLFGGSKEDFVSLANSFWSDTMDRFKVPEELRHTSMAASVNGEQALAKKVEISAGQFDTVAVPTNEMLMDSLVRAFDPTSMPDLYATIQFTLRAGSDGYDGGPADWFLSLQPGKCVAHAGRTPLPSLSIDSPRDVWLSIIEGGYSPDEAFSEEKFEASGAIGLMTQFSRLFLFDTHAHLEDEPVHQEESMPTQNAIDNATPDGVSELDALSLRDVVAGMALVFNPAAANGLHAVLQFQFTGDEPGQYFLTIADGTCRFAEGESPSPDMTIIADAAVWKAISSGKLDGQTAFMQGKYKANGDFRLLMKLDSLFSSPSNTPQSA
jgi:putative sterol carrier protein